MSAREFGDPEQGGKRLVVVKVEMQRKLKNSGLYGGNHFRSNQMSPSINKTRDHFIRTVSFDIIYYSAVKKT